MKKYLIPAIAVLIISFAIAIFLILKSTKPKKNNLSTRPLYIKTLKEGIATQNISIEEACKNPNLVNKKILEITDAGFEERFIYLCEDHKLANELKENFNSNSDYRYFLNCAKNYAAEMQQLMRELQEHYPEDYKNLNFKSEEILLRYLKHPDSAYLQVQCESKSEALYWRALSESDKVEDLQFCIQTTKDCMSGKSKPEECPADFKKHHDECSKKFNKMKAQH